MNINRYKTTHLITGLVSIVFSVFRGDTLGKFVFTFLSAQLLVLIIIATVKRIIKTE